MESFRFVHAADLHIDSPFAGLMATNEIIATRLREATHAAFRNLIEFCIHEKVDFLVIAGDVYDGADRAPRAQLRFLRGLRELAEAGIQSFVVHGNHDPLDGRYSSISWPDKVHIFGETPSWATATRNGEPIAEIQGVSYPQREVRENLASQFSPRRSNDLFNIGLLHCNVGGNTDHDNYAPCTVDDLVQVGLDYWALGHVHMRQTLKTGNPFIAYPGNTQGRHPNEAGAHGCLLIDVDTDGSVQAEFRELDVARWESVEVSIDGLPGIDDLYETVSDRLAALHVSADGRDVICGLTLTGRGPLHDELAQITRLDGFLEEIRANQQQDSPCVWIERITNNTRPDLDLDSRAAQNDFLGLVLQRARAANPKEFTDLLAVVFSGRRDRLPVPSEEEIQGWIMEAEWLIAEWLETNE